jgi:hypothetical protein
VVKKIGATSLKKSGVSALGTIIARNNYPWENSNAQECAMLYFLYRDKFESLVFVDVVERLARNDRGSTSVHFEGANSRHNNGALQ